MIAEYQRQLMQSPLCRGKVEAITTELRYEFDSVVVVIEGVPAFRCEGRDDDLIPGPLGIALGELAFEIAEQAQTRLAELTAEADEPIETRIKIPDRLRRFVSA